MRFGKGSFFGHEKGRLAPPFGLTLYFYFTKWDGFTTPSFEIFYLDGNEGVRRMCAGWRGLTSLTAWGAVKGEVGRGGAGSRAPFYGVHLDP